MVRREKVAISTAGLEALQVGCPLRACSGMLRVVLSYYCWCVDVPLQERLVSQRYYLGKKKAVLSQLEEYERLMEVGSSLAGDSDERPKLKNDVMKE